MSGTESLAADGESEPGTILSFRSRGQDRESTITEWDPGRAVTLESTQGGVTATYRYRCEPTPDGTSVSLHAQCETQVCSGGWQRR